MYIYKVAVFLVIILEINASSKDEYHPPESTYTIFLELLQLDIAVDQNLIILRLSHGTLHIYARTHRTHIIIVIMQPILYNFLPYVRYNIVTVIKYKCSSRHKKIIQGDSSDTLLYFICTFRRINNPGDSNGGSAETRPRTVCGLQDCMIIVNFDTIDTRYL